MLNYNVKFVWVYTQFVLTVFSTYTYVVVLGRLLKMDLKATFTDSMFTFYWWWHHNWLYIMRPSNYEMHVKNEVSFVKYCFDQQEYL